jgi:hypothetical protein
MRRIPLAALLAALSLAACRGPCEELGSRLCRCVGAGTTRDTCERQVKNELDRVNPGQDVEDFCDQRLGTCNEPTGADFCEWTQTGCGKASCGLSAETTEQACAAPAP